MAEGLVKRWVEINARKALGSSLGQTGDCIEQAEEGHPTAGELGSVQVPKVRTALSVVRILRIGLSFVFFECPVDDCRTEIVALENTAVGDESGNTASNESTSAKAKDVYCIMPHFAVHSIVGNAGMNVIMATDRGINILDTRLNRVCVDRILVLEGPVAHGYLYGCSSGPDCGQEAVVRSPQDDHTENQQINEREIHDNPPIQQVALNTYAAEIEYHITLVQNEISVDR